MISHKFIAGVKLSEKRAYKIAHEAGVDPSVLSKLLCGIVKPKNNDHRVISVGRVLGLKPEECFEKGTAAQ